MNRREALQALGAVAASPAFFAAGRSLHARAARGLQILDTQQNETVATIGEIIIPTTETPGARAAKCSEFIDVMLGEWVDPEERTKFLRGLAELDARTQTLFGKAFTGCTPDQQTQFVMMLEAEVAAFKDAQKAGQKADPSAAVACYQMTKRGTVVGYYTSEIGFNQELHDAIIPGRWDACAPIERGAN
jgi:Gluconate 2-dehydrogenase subunit 3